METIKKIKSFITELFRNNDPEVKVGQIWIHTSKEDNPFERTTIAYSITEVRGNFFSSQIIGNYAVKTNHINFLHKCCELETTK